MTTKPCPFCNYTGPSEVMWRNEDDTVYAINPMYPAVPGHTLIIPNWHQTDPAASPGSTGFLFEEAARFIRWAGIDSYNLILNKGRPATQSVDHMHVHIVPRFAKDGVPLPWSHPDTLRRYIEKTPVEDRS